MDQIECQRRGPASRHDRAKTELEDGRVLRLEREALRLDPPVVRFTAPPQRLRVVCEEE